MDIALLRTFVEIAATGSFVAAADRLFVTTSAVSLRVQRLEAALGRTLFERSKAGAKLTPAGVAFEPYALSMLRIWAESRQSIAVPDGFARTLSIGAQYSLWPRLGFRWIDALGAAMPDLSVRAEIGMPDRLTRFLVDGSLHVALTYSPTIRPGLRAEMVLEDELVLVSALPLARDEIGARYVMVDWGPEFVQAHALQLPDLPQGGVTLSLGAMAADYIVTRGKAAFVPARYAKRWLDAGALHLVPDTPRFPFPVWAVWREDIDANLAADAGKVLAAVVAEADEEQEEVLLTLDAISASDPGLLGVTD